eukprot:GHUV01037208.1.p1 GENE.GHUV01037208.1~~GHUV01037208.1.p1  ORF type:complete len:291 (+),score=79.13 GHUV01037208.1:98-970(+)
MQQCEVWRLHLPCRGCIFQVLPEVAQAPAAHPASTDPTTYWRLRTSWPYSAATASFLQSQQLQETLQDCLGTQTVLLYNEQYIIKPPHSNRSSFGWHYDSQSCGTDQGVKYSQYLSLWIALDDMMAENGCLVVLPSSHPPAGIGTCGCGNPVTKDWPANRTTSASHNRLLGQQPPLETHPACTAGCTGSCCSRRQAALQQPVQYIAVNSTEQLQDALSSSCGCCGGREAVNKPLGLLLPAGTAVLFWDTLWHCSGPNNSRYTRTAYMAQFSSEPLTWEDSGQPVGLAIPL